MDLPYGDDIIDMKVEEISDAYLNAPDKFIGDEIVIPGRDELPILLKVKKHKRDASGNPIGNKTSIQYCIPGFMTLIFRTDV